MRQIFLALLDIMAQGAEAHNTHLHQQQEFMQQKNILERVVKELEEVLLNNHIVEEL
jgi:hypothetical protein